jgi:prepilin-type N-terminal cleavage/methylation domain-containing protein
MRQQKSNIAAQAGFTIVELMVATLVFSVILVVITSGIISFTQGYYKGINSSATQNAARNVANTIARNLEYGGGEDNLFPVTVSGNNYALCIGDSLIDYNLGGQLGTPGNTYGVYTATHPVGSCPVYPPGAQGNELLGPNMRVTNLSVKKVSGVSGNLYSINIGVAYGDIDLLCDKSITPGTSGSCSPTDTTHNGDIDWANHGKTVICKGGKSSRFCAVSHLSTQVSSRFKP